MVQDIPPSFAPSTDETTHVVIEPKKPNQPRKKQYVALVTFTFDHYKAKKGDLLRLTEVEAQPLLGAHLIVPIDVAIRLKLYPPEKETVIEKVVEAVTGEEITPEETTTISTSSTKATSKNLLGNKLRDAVQAKKKSETSKNKAPLSADKLAAIKSGGRKT